MIVGGVVVKVFRLDGNCSGKGNPSLPPSFFSFFLSKINALETGFEPFIQWGEEE